MPVTLYGEDLAHIHQAGYGDLAVSAAERLIEELGRSKASGGVVVELGAGPGLTAARLLSAKYQVVVIDQSEEMLALARGNAPRAEFVHGSWTSADIPPCDAVIAVGEVFNYVLDASTSMKSLERLFSRVFKALWPGGLFVFDVAGPGRIPGGGPETSTTVGEDWGVIVTASEDRRGTLTRHIVTLRKTPDGIRTGEETHKQRLIPQAKVLEMLRKAGFKARSLQGYAGERFAPGHSVFVARRP